MLRRRDLSFAQYRHASDTALYAVSYVEVMPSARAAMVAALTQYRDTSRKEDGYVRFELLEQVDRSGHVAVVEVWKDQKASTTTSVPTRLLPLLQQLRRGTAKPSMSWHMSTLTPRLDLSRSRDERADSSHRERLPQVSRIPVD